MLRVIRASGLRWLWITMIILLVDRFTKIAAQKYLTAYVAHPVFSFFNLTLAYNKGAAFSFLDKAAGWQMYFFGSISTIVAIGILIWMMRLPARARWLNISLALIVGGAVGNLWDRISLGHVIDFLDFHVSNWHWPVFNVADSAICIGVFMLICEALLKKK